MTTTVVKTIGSTGDYSTPALWIAACPANLVTSDQVWQGQCQNQTFSVGSGAVCTISGITTDATRYVELTTVAGASFSDNASVQSNALAYNTSNGAALTTTGGYATALDITVANTRVRKLQIAATAASSIAISHTGAGLIDRCILEGASSALGAAALNPASGTLTVTNSLFVQRTASATKIVGTTNTTTIVNCTFAVPSDKAAATYGIDGSYASATLKNCAVFGVTNAIETGNSTFTNTTCRTDAASPPTGFTTIVYNTSTGSGFQNITDATRDFRIKTGSAMLDVGTTDVTNAATDIAGTSRPSGSAYDIGAWELVAAGGAFTPNKRKLLIGVG